MWPESAFKTLTRCAYFWLKSDNKCRTAAYQKFYVA